MVCLDGKSREILVALCREHDIRKMILFGSRADGTCHERSDVDIAVQGIDTLGYSDFVEDIENSDIIYMVDVVHLDSPTVSYGVRQEIEEKGVTLYEKI